MKVDAPVAETLLSADDEDGITITTATQSVEQLRENLGVAPPELTDEEKTHAETAALAERAKVIDPELDAALDKVEPPKKDETPAERDARRSRSQRKITKEIGLRKQAEEETARLRAENAALKAAAATPAGAKKPDDPPAAEKPAPFAFPTFAEYQEEHPDAEYEQWFDARADARDEWKETRRQATVAATHENLAERETFEKIGQEVETFKTRYPDYDTVVNTAETPFEDDGKGGRRPTQQTVYLQKLVTREGPDRVAPTLYWLAQPKQKDVLAKLLSAPNLTEMLVAFGTVRAHVDTWLESEAGQKAAPAVKAEATPVRIPKAPAPVTHVKGGDEHVRSAAQISEEDGEDADAYIEKRNAEMRRAG